MQTLNDLLDKIKKTRSLASDNALATALGQSRQNVSNWRLGKRLPDAVACAQIAELSGEPLARVLGIVGVARAISREEKAVWRQLASMAASVLLTTGAIGALTLPAWVSAAARSMAGASLYIMLKRRDAVEAFRSLKQYLARDTAHEFIAPHSFDKAARESVAAA